MDVSVLRRPVFKPTNHTIFREGSALSVSKPSNSAAIFGSSSVLMETIAKDAGTERGN